MAKSAELKKLHVTALHGQPISTCTLCAQIEAEDAASASRDLAAQGLGDQCTFEGCQAFYRADLDIESQDGKSGYTGWYWPHGVDNEPDDVPAHDHMIPRPDPIMMASYMALRGALGIEIKTGMKRSSHGRPSSVIANEHMGTNIRGKRATYDAFNKWLVMRGAKDRPLS